MLQLDGVRLRQGQFTLTADFSVVTGQIVAVMGPSGSGKSTLIAAIAGFVRPEAGQIVWQGQELTDLPPGQRPISVLFQDNNLFPHLTLMQNLALGIRPSGRVSITDEQQIDDVLLLVGLPGLGSRKPGTLSGGQQSRAALARVMLGRRPLVLLDEPFAALGPGLKDEMLDLVQATLGARGQTVVMVTHDPADAVRIAHQIIAVEAGSVLGPVPTAAFLAEPPPGLRAYLGQAKK
jgi:thiamine transport system ATP-binding protein